jgi:NAD(P)-dependent dehydrogenase (short-subunit alcohol dehydrogenase family)
MAKDNPIRQVRKALKDMRKAKEEPLGLEDTERLDGKTCLITGASSGLGKAVAVALAERGAHVIMACRSGIPEVGEEVRERSSGSVEMLPVDLADLDSVRALADVLKARNVRLDVTVLSAAVMPRSSRLSVQGYELMFQVNYLAHFALVKRLLEDGTIPNCAFADGATNAPPSRLIIVSSETHRDAPALDFETLGDYVEYGLTSGMAQYGHTKLLLCTMAKELERRLNGKAGVEVGVHSLCPGPINSKLARETPVWAKPILKPIMKWFFNSPEVAAKPVVFMACARALDHQTGKYMHMMVHKEPDEKAQDPGAGKRLFETSVTLLNRVQEKRA